MNSSSSSKIPQRLAHSLPRPLQREPDMFMFPSRSGKTSFASAIFGDVVPAELIYRTHGGRLQIAGSEASTSGGKEMQSQLWRCDNCGWGTFEPTHPRKIYGGRVHRHEDGSEMEICGGCLGLLGTAPKHELAQHVKTPTRPVREPK